MYGFMTSANFYLFVQVSHHEIKPYMPEFCFMMQIAMIGGFITAYSVNWWRLRKGI